jgi:hypothetical protein
MVLASVAMRVLSDDLEKKTTEQHELAANIIQSLLRINEYLFQQKHLDDYDPGAFLSVRCQVVYIEGL